MVLRLELIPGDILFLILIPLTLGTLGNIIAIITGDAQKVAKHVFKAKILNEILYGTSQFYIEAPTIAFPNQATVAVQLVIGTRADRPGQIEIHYTPTAATGPANNLLFLELIAEIGLEIDQPNPQDPQGSDICFKKDSDLTVNPKRYMTWELVSTKGKTNQYKFFLENHINHVVPWKGLFAKVVEVYVKTRIEPGGLFAVEDVFFKFEDLFYICKCSLKCR